MCVRAHTHVSWGCSKVYQQPRASVASPPAPSERGWLRWKRVREKGRGGSPSAHAHIGKIIHMHTHKCTHNTKNKNSLSTEIIITNPVTLQAPRSQLDQGENNWCWRQEGASEWTQGGGLFALTIALRLLSDSPWQPTSSWLRAVLRWEQRSGTETLFTPLHTHTQPNNQISRLRLWSH